MPSLRVFCAQELHKELTAFVNEVAKQVDDDWHDSYEDNEETMGKWFRVRALTSQSCCLSVRFVWPPRFAFVQCLRITVLIDFC